MSSPPVALLAERTSPLKGVQTPRILCAQTGDSTAGVEAADWLARNGVVLDPWQRLVFEKALSERDDGRWSSFEVCLTVGRQNGKTLLLAARELAGLFLFDEELIVHTAHQWKTAHKSFKLVEKIIRNAPDLMSRVKRFSASPGLDVVLLKDGRSLEFIARTKKSGLGWSADCVVMDEAFDLIAEELGVLMPTLSAMPNPQIWYASSAPKAHSEQLFRLRDRALAGDSRRFCYLEWSAPEGSDPTDRHAWAQANPALGIRISEEFFEAEQRSLDAHEFGRECLGWPDSLKDGSVFPPGAWADAADPRSKITGQVAFAVDVNPDRTIGSISVAGLRGDGLIHVELIDNRERTGWILNRLVELDRQWGPVAVLVDEGGPAGSLIGDLERAGLTVTKMTGRQVAQATGYFFDGIVHGTIHHKNQDLLNAAAYGAATRPLVDAWAWGRKGSDVDISPLVAATLAHWGLSEHLDGGGLAPDDVYVGKF